MSMEDWSKYVLKVTKGQCQSIPFKNTALRVINMYTKVEAMEIDRV